MTLSPPTLLWIMFAAGALCASAAWAFGLAIRWRHRPAPPPEPARRPREAVRPPAPSLPDLPVFVAGVTPATPHEALPLAFAPDPRTWSTEAETVPDPRRVPAHLKTAELTADDLEEAEADLRKVKESTFPRVTVPREFRGKDPR